MNNSPSVYLNAVAYRYRFFKISSYSHAYVRIIYEKTRIKHRVACVANVSVWFQSKETTEERDFPFWQREK